MGATYAAANASPSSMGRQVEILKAAKPDAVICSEHMRLARPSLRDAVDLGADSFPVPNLSFGGSESLLHDHRRRPSGTPYTTLWLIRGCP